MDKLTLGFLADILYIKGFINLQEFQAIQDVKTPMDVNDVVEKMLGGEYSGHFKGEGYIVDIKGD